MRFRLLLCASAGAAFLGGYFVASSDTARLSGVHRFVRRAAAAGEIVARASVGRSENRAVHAAISALEEKDSLRRDHLLYLAIEEMNGADFQALFADLPALWKKVQDLSYETQQMLLEAAAERWLSVDANGAMRWLDGGVLLLGLAEKGGQTVDVQQLGGLFKVLARHQPEWVLRHLDKLGDGRFPWGARFMTVQELVLAAAKRDRAEALRLIEQMPGDQTPAWSGLIGGVAESDPLAAFELALGQKHKPSFASLAAISAKTAAKDGAASVQNLLDRIDDQVIRREMIWAALHGWSAYSSANPLPWFTEQLESDPKLLTQTNSRDAALHTLARRAPEETAELIVHVEAPNRGDLLRTIINTWSGEAPDEALAWLSRQPPELLQDSAHLDDILQTTSRNAPEEFAKWFTTLPAGKLRAAAETVGAGKLIENGRIDEALGLAATFLPYDPSGKRVARIAQVAAERDPSATAAWIAGLAESRAQQNVAAAVAVTWGAAKPTEAAAWIESLPAGEVRDAAIGGYARVVAYAEPSIATEWLDRIRSERIKEPAVREVFWTWSREDPVKARQYLQQVTGVGAEWKVDFLRAAAL